MTRPRLEVADVVQQYGAAYLARYGHATSAAQHRVLRAESREMLGIMPPTASPQP